MGEITPPIFPNAGSVIGCINGINPFGFNKKSLKSNLLSKESLRVFFGLVDCA